MTETVHPSLSEAEIGCLAALLAAIRNLGALIASPAPVMPHEYGVSAEFSRSFKALVPAT